MSMVADDGIDLIAEMQGRADVNRPTDVVVDKVRQIMVKSGFKFRDTLEGVEPLKIDEAQLSGLTNEAQYFALTLVNFLHTPFLDYPDGVITVGDNIDSFDEQMRNRLQQPDLVAAYDWLKEQNRWKSNTLGEVHQKILEVSEEIVEVNPLGAMNLQMIASTLTPIVPEGISYPEMQKMKQTIVSKEPDLTPEQVNGRLEEEYYARTHRKYYYKFMTIEEKTAMQKQYAKAAQLSLRVLVGEDVSEDEITELASMAIPVGAERKAVVDKKEARYAQIKSNSSI